MLPEQPQDISALQDRLEEITFYQRLDHELTWVLDVNHVVDIAMDWAMRRTAATTALMATRQEKYLTAVRVIGATPTVTERLMREPWPINGGLMSQAVKSGEIIHSTIGADGPPAPLIDDETLSMLTLPLSVRKQVIGVIHLESPEPDHFTDDMVSFLRAVAPRIAVALHNAEIHSRARNAERLKSDMIRMASHDLRGPLTTIANALTLVQRVEGQLPELAKTGVESIAKAANEMQMLIDELLTLEKLESEAEMIYEPVNMLRILDEALERTQKPLEAKQHTLIRQAPDEPIFVRGEVAFYRQAMINLISNAIKYTAPEGEITVRLEQHGSRVFFDVKDTGYGISPDRQNRLFERFYRAKEPSTTHIAGTGLGLSLVKAIVERGKGEVWFQSAPDKGSTFGFWLPITEVEVDDKKDNMDTQPTTPPVLLTQVLQRRHIRQAGKQSFQ